jgi:hypothetical protein
MKSASVNLDGGACIAAIEPEAATFRTLKRCCSDAPPQASTDMAAAIACLVAAARRMDADACAGAR